MAEWKDREGCECRIGLMVGPRIYDGKAGTLRVKNVEL